MLTLKILSSIAKIQNCQQHFVFYFLIHIAKGSVLKESAIPAREKVVFDSKEQLAKQDPKENPLPVFSRT